jgi:integrase/recombinase XerD
MVKQKSLIDRYQDHLIGQGKSPFEVLEEVWVKEQRDTAPRWLTRQEQLALMRAVRSGGSQRDLAVVQTLLGTGLRISELAALTVSDVEISDRKGTLYMRERKGGVLDIAAALC